MVEMDGFDGRFVCGGCRASGGEGEGRKALTWRECVCLSTLLFRRGVLIKIQVQLIFPQCIMPVPNFSYAL